jgi:hypothetical protein
MQAILVRAGVVSQITKQGEEMHTHLDRLKKQKKISKRFGQENKQL